MKFNILLLLFLTIVVSKQNNSSATQQQNQPASTTAGDKDSNSIKEPVKDNKDSAKDNTSETTKEESVATQVQAQPKPKKTPKISEEEENDIKRIEKNIEDEKDHESKKKIKLEKESEAKEKEIRKNLKREKEKSKNLKKEKLKAKPKDLVHLPFNILHTPRKSVIPVENKTKFFDQEKSQLLMKSLFLNVEKFQSPRAPINKLANNQANVLSELENLKKMMSQMKEWTKRNSYKEINTFCHDFQVNMNALLSLANLFEEKTLLKIENTSNEIINLITLEIDPSKKGDIIANKLDSIYIMISNEFDSVLTKVEQYESTSKIKITRMRESFKQGIGKFISLT